MDAGTLGSCRCRELSLEPCHWVRLREGSATEQAKDTGDTRVLVTMVSRAGRLIQTHQTMCMKCAHAFIGRLHQLCQLLFFPKKSMQSAGLEYKEEEMLKSALRIHGNFIFY